MTKFRNSFSAVYDYSEIMWNNTPLEVALWSSSRILHHFAGVYEKERGYSGTNRFREGDSGYFRFMFREIGFKGLPFKVLLTKSHDSLKEDKIRLDARVVGIDCFRSLDVNVLDLLDDVAQEETASTDASDYSWLANPSDKHDLYVDQADAVKK